MMKQQGEQNYQNPCFFSSEDGWIITWQIKSINSKSSCILCSFSCFNTHWKCRMNMDVLDTFVWSTVHPHLSLSHGSPSMVCPSGAASCLQRAGGRAVRLCHRSSGSRGQRAALWLLLFVASSLIILKCEWSWILFHFEGSQGRPGYKTFL